MENIILSSTNLIGTDIKSRQNDNLGTIKDVVIDMEANKVAFLVVAFSGSPDLDIKYYALPLEAFDVDENDEKLILNTKISTIKNAPGFSKEISSFRPDRDFLSEVYNYYDIKPYFKTAALEVSEHFTSGKHEPKDDDLDWNPDRHLDESINKSNFREKIPDSATRNREQDPDRNRYLF